MTKILIVDDQKFALETLRDLLRRAGYEVACKSDGFEALEVLRDGEFRLVISDWMMARMDGLELCRQIRSQEFSGYVYVILLTSRSGKRDAIEGLSAGADDLVTKPFDPGELLARVRIGERILSLETRDVAIFAMAKLAESRDPETGEHLERMRLYSRMITESLIHGGGIKERVSEDFPKLIYLTSPLHDIGKVGIPDGVLLKPGRLSDLEFDIMKTHTTIGAATLDAAVRQYPGVTYLQLARSIALTHHERFDGSGYPQGLVGENIPLCGRIVALADVYDALTSKRVYKQAFTHHVARGIILNEVGKHFDPIIIEAFLHCEQQFVSVLKSYSNPELAGE